MSKPTIRFKGYTDDWEQCKFDKCFNFPVSTNSLSRALLNYDEGEIKSIHYGDILVNYPSILNVKTDKIPYITDGKLEKYKANLLKNGDLIFADAAEDETVGKAVEVNNIREEYLVSGLHTIVARAKEKKAEFFLGYYINSDNYHRQLLRLMQGSKVSSISKGNLQKTFVSFPKDIKEQQKIGQFFKQLDDTIALHQRKLELLKEQKKGFLQKMFPKSGQKVPEIRFEGFTDDWKQRKLGELYKTYSGMTPLRSDSSNYDNPTVPWIKTTDLRNMEILANEEKISDKAVSKLKVLPKDTVLIAMYGGFNQIGRTGLLTYPSAINQALTALEPNGKINPYFLITELNFRVKDWKKLAASSRKDPNITKKDVEDFTLLFPNLMEQQKIGQFFKQLDNTIALHQRKLDKLKQMKQAFLQKMFV